MSEALEKFMDEIGPYTTDDIEALPDGQRAELIDGYIYMMSSPTFAHQIIAGSLHHRILSHLEAHNGKCTPIMAPFTVYLDGKKSKKHWCEPDVYVVCDKKKIHDDAVYGAPDWIIEIASPSSLSKDLVKKPEAYQRYGVKEYWCINPMDKSLYVWLFSDDLSLSKCTFSDEISPSLYPDFKVKIDDLLP